MSASPKHVVFVCTGNVCRSPMAEGFLRAMVEDLAPGSITVSSAGVGAFDGQSPSRNSIIAMKQEGIDISNQRSQMLTQELIHDATHIFGMASSHQMAIQALFPEAIEKTFVLRELIVDDELDRDVPDPIGMDLDEYERTRNLIKEAMPSVLQFVTGHSSGSDLLPGEDDEEENSSTES